MIAEKIIKIAEGAESILVLGTLNKRIFNVINPELSQVLIFTKGIVDLDESDKDHTNNYAYRIGQYKDTPVSGFRVYNSSGVISDFDLVIVNTRGYKNIKESIRNIKYNKIIFLQSDDYTSEIKRLENEMIQHMGFSLARKMLVNGEREKFSILFKEGHSTVENWYSDGEPISIFLVLKSGGDVYNHRYVNATARSIKANITYPHEIVCLTDNSNFIDPSVVDRIVPLKHNWPGWWSKIEIFRSDITKNKHALYIDLDTVVCGNIDDICRANLEFSPIRDLYTYTTLQTGIIKWNVEVGYPLYREFLHNANSLMAEMVGGDHLWINKKIKKCLPLQDVFERKIVSYKKSMNEVMSGAVSPSIICFHGNPRPHTVTDGIILESWKY